MILEKKCFPFFEIWYNFLKMKTIGRIAKETGLLPSTLRYYEKIGLLPKPKRGGNRYRFYDEEDEKRLAFILKARALGFRLGEISHILDLREKGMSPCLAVRKIIQEKSEKLKEQILFLSQLQEELEQFLKRVPPQGIEGEICGCIETHQVLLKKNFPRRD
jgi:MerR family mercuric resistance operon transcriptional regulator